MTCQRASRKLAITRACDVCGSLLDVERYSMQHKQRIGSQPTTEVTNTTSSLSMGGIDMCFSCWVRIAKPRMEQYMAGITTCDLCDADVNTLRLTLKQSQRIEGKVRDRGRGSIVLCLADWQRIGLPHMRSKPNKQQDPARLFAVNAYRVRKG
jgi:hypothetical protein